MPLLNQSPRKPVSQFEPNPEQQQVQPPPATAGQNPPAPTSVSALEVVANGTGDPAGTVGTDQTTEQVQMAQKLFKRFGGKRLDIFKSIQQHPPEQQSSMRQQVVMHQQQMPQAATSQKGHSGKKRK